MARQTWKNWAAEKSLQSRPWESNNVSHPWRGKARLPLSWRGVGGFRLIYLSLSLWGSKGASAVGGGARGGSLPHGCPSAGPRHTLARGLPGVVVPNPRLGEEDHLGALPQNSPPAPAAAWAPAPPRAREASQQDSPHSRRFPLAAAIEGLPVPQCPAPPRLMRRRTAGERSARPPQAPASNPRPPSFPLTADPLRRVEALGLLQEAARLLRLAGLNGGHRDSNTALRLVPVGFHGGGAGRRRTGIASLTTASLPDWESRRCYRTAGRDYRRVQNSGASSQRTVKSFCETVKRVDGNHT